MDPESIPLRVATGQSRWTELNGVDFWIEKVENGWRFGPFSGTPLQVTEKELLLGIGNLREKPESLREWASFILAAPCYDFEELDCSILGEKLLEKLWDISFGTIRETDLDDLLNSLRPGEAEPRGHVS